MADTCRAEWCVALPVAGSSYCAIHRKAPPQHNLETAKDWRTRTVRSNAAKQRAATKAAESDAVLAKRGGVREAD